MKKNQNKLEKEIEELDNEIKENPYIEGYVKYILKDFREACRDLTREINRLIEEIKKRKET